MNQRTNADCRDDEFAILRELIPVTTTLSVAQEPLRNRGIPFSASSWDDLFDNRLKPALEQRKITCLDLFEILREEEYGRQNIFLYRCPRAAAKELLREDRIRSVLKRRALDPLLERPVAVRRPEQPRIVEARLQREGSDSSFVLKVVMTRVYREQVEERPSEGGRITVVFETKEERSVSLFRLHESGLLELRIQSRDRDVGKYRSDMRMMWELAGDLLPFGTFQAVSVQPTRESLWRQRSQLKGQLRFSYLRCRNAAGNVLQVSMGDPIDDLADDAGAGQATQEFLQHNGYLESVNLWWLSSPARPLPSKNIHMNLGGQLNELAITTRRTRDDDAYVLDLVEAHNR